jgi:NhaP-type Na+/H+ or K+/H+ antiporter
MVIGESASPGAVVLNFIRLAGGGPLLGVVFGLFSCLWLRRIIRDDILASALTFITCYISFYCAEFTFLGVSGILCIVCLGLFMSAFGKSKIYAESEHAIHTVWGFAQYGCETLIFLLTGILIGIEMIEKSTITGEDWIKMLIFYFIMLVARFIMVGTLYPILSNTGYGLTKVEAVVLCYGGLRGALGLTLSLMVGVDLRVPQRLRELTVFYMAGMACLTLLVNGTTCASLVGWLGMIEVPETKHKIEATNKKRLYL